MPARTSSLLLLALCLILLPAHVWANHPGFAPCPTVTPPNADAPGSVVVVSILSIKPNTDLEGDDDNIPFYDNHADIYGKVTIDGQTFDLPKIDENDFPHWYSDGVFSQPVSSGPVHISIYIKESDGGLTGDDDVVDVSPVAGKDSLDIDYDLCSLRISGDVGSTTPGDNLGQTQNVIEVSGGTGDDAATIRFKIELQDGRPVTVQDLALVDADFVQVVLHQSNIVAGKPTILRVRLASNYTSQVSTMLHVVIIGGISIDQTFPVDIGAGEVKQVDLFTDSPLVFPPDGAPYTPFVRISVDDPNAAPPGDCRNENNQIVSGSEVIPFSSPGIASAGVDVFWQVIATRTQQLVWAPVGTLLDIANCASDEDVETIRDLGTAFIKGTYPIPGVDNSTSPVCLIAPGAAELDFVATILAGFGIPADGALPFGLVFELSETAGLVNSIPYFSCDRLMGVLPNNWFDRFIYDLWADVTGLSLGEFAPHAVILLASSGGDPMLTLPAHELGHTFGLSLAPDIKSWICGQDLPGDVDVLACGAFGGYDEYRSESSIAGMQDGRPSNGYWIRQGGEPAAIPDAVFGAQCNSHCLMGNGPVNPQDTWYADRRWIDAEDYDQLLRKLSTVPLAAAPKMEQPAAPGEVIFVSGMIAYDDNMYLGPWFRASGVRPDRMDSFGLYAIRFVSSTGQTLGEVGLPVDWTTPDVNGGVPITFFGLYVPWAPGTDHIEIWNRQNGHLLGTRPVSPNAPQVQIVAPTPGQIVEGGCGSLIEWEASDADGDPLTFTVLLRPAGANGWPVATHLTAHQFVLDTSAVPPGDYEVTVVAADGVNVGTSQPVAFTLRAGTGTDTAPPTIEVTLDPDVLWPANHKLCDIHATVVVHDDCDPNPTFVLTSIHNRESDNAVGDGNTDNDVQGASLGTPDVDFQLRAERSGRGDGRLYVVTYTATDAAGNTATAVANVTVPRDRQGLAMASNGFESDGTAISGNAASYFVAIPSRGTGPKIDASHCVVGNEIGTIRPLSSRLVDLDGDASAELVLEFPAEATRRLVEASARGQSLGLRYADEVGTGFVVPDIFALGAPVPLPAHSDPRDGSTVDPAQRPGAAASEQFVPSRTQLRGVQPNPFNPTATVSFDLVAAGRARIQVFDLRGALVRTLVDADLPAGRHETIWRGEDEHGRPVSSGVYLFRLVTAGGVQTCKAVLVR